jgi:hypothetical protein
MATKWSSMPQNSLKIIDEVIALSGERTSASLTYQISIPPDVNLYIYSDDFDTGRSFSARGLSGEVEINIQEGDIRLTDITGPLMVKANSGNVTVEFSEVNQDSPMSLVCSRGDIDVTLPGTSEVTLKLKASSGEVFTDLDITEQEDSFHASFDRLIMKSPDNELAWSYSFDSSLVDNWQELSDARDLTGIYVHPDEKRITVMERNARKRNRVEPFFMPMEEYKRATDLYVDALGLYSSKYGSYYLGQDFPFLLGLMYDFTGDINGGGVEIGIRTEQGNIYLRKSE